MKKRDNEMRLINEWKEGTDKLQMFDLENTDEICLGKDNRFHVEMTFWQRLRFCLIGKGYCEGLRCFNIKNGFVLVRKRK